MFKTTITIGTTAGTPKTLEAAGIGCHHPVAGSVSIADWALLTAVDCLERVGIEGATVIPCVGVWRGQVESSVRVELLHDDSPITRNRIALYVQAAHRAFAAGGLAQDAILVEQQGQARVEFITRETAIG